MRLLLICLLLGLLAGTASAQPEMVPADHEVYRFLHSQRVAGLLPGYRHEARPLDRRAVRTLLDSLSARADRLPALARRWLRTYRQEFFEPPGRVEALLSDEGFRLPRGRDTEKAFYYHNRGDWRFAVHGSVTPGYRAARDSVRHAGAGLTAGLRAEGNYRDVVGFYSRTINGRMLGGDARVLTADPDLGTLFYVNLADVPPGSFDQSAASVRASGRAFFAELAHARLLMGTGFDDGLLFTDGTDHFSFLRVGLDTRRVQYQFLHAALGDRSRLVRPDSAAAGVLIGPERYLAMHRIAVHPWGRLSLAFTEMVVYGQRGPELAYLNPVNPIKTAEHALWDRDNSLFSLEAVGRPFRGVEAYLSWLVDDLFLARAGRGSYNNKWAIQAGAGLTLPFGLLAWGEYTRIEPFVYTHRFELDGSFYNSYLHNGFSMGHPLGPNADQWSAGLRGWLPGRLSGSLTARYARRGENYLDPEGALVNVGGDVRNGRSPDFTQLTKRFLGGHRYEGAGLEASIRWEPVREVTLAWLGTWQQWNARAPAPPEPDRLFSRITLTVDL